VSHAAQAPHAANAEESAKAEKAATKVHGFGKADEAFHKIAAPPVEPKPAVATKPDTGAASR